MNLPFQLRLVEIIRQQVPKNISLPHELSSILGVSVDSAYRRLRCETAFSLDETVAVCKHFEVPLELLNDMLVNVVSFRYMPAGRTPEEFKGFLAYFLGNIKSIAHFEEKRIFYAAEDIPLFHLYNYEKLSAFKFFYWKKTILNHSDLQGLRFQFGLSDPELAALASKASLAYAEVESTEIWTEETMSSTLRQVKFYWEAGLFENQEDALAILEELRILIKNLHRQCDLGLKIRPGGGVSNTTFHCYVSDLMIGNNCVLVHTNERKTTFLGYNTFNFMSTGSHIFNEQNETWMQNLISKSTLISRTAEKIRNRFFKTLEKQIDDLQRFVMEN